MIKFRLARHKSTWLVSSLPLKVRCASHDGNALVHDPFPYTEIVVHELLDLFAFGDLVGVQTDGRGEASTALYARQEGGK